MYLRLNYQSGEAIYRQIVEQIKYRVASGELSPGQRLPSIRELAKQLKINPRTVVKSYEELRAAGLAVMRQGQGVFIDSADKPLFLRAPVWWAVGVIRATRITSYFANFVSISCGIA